MPDRIRRLLRLLPPELDGALITAEPSRFYLCGVRSSDGMLLVTREQSVLLIDFRYIEAARESIHGAEAVLLDSSTDQLAALCGALRIRRLGVEGTRLTVAQEARLRQRLSGIELIDDLCVDNALCALRRRKDASELSAIRAAQAITDATFTELCDFIRPGITEREVAARLEYILKQRGAAGTAFETIAVSGANSSRPHGVPNEKTLRAGELLTLDFGAVSGGYCSDMTRTVAIGYADEEMQALYATVLQAQRAALAVIRPGCKCRDIDAAARDIIEDGGYRGCFGHGLGHAVGIEVHEEPRFSPYSADIAAVGDVMSVEPGIYLDGRFGCRIEDLVHLTPDGCENFTKSKKELIIL